jgi:hypothetical protein
MGVASAQPPGGTWKQNFKLIRYIPMLQILQTVLAYLHSQCRDKLLIFGAGSSCQHVRHMTLHCIVLCLTLFDIALEEISTLIINLEKLK